MIQEVSVLQKDISLYEGTKTKSTTGDKHTVPQGKGYHCLLSLKRTCTEQQKQPGLRILAYTILNEELKWNKDFSRKARHPEQLETRPELIMEILDKRDQDPEAFLLSTGIIDQTQSHQTKHNQGNGKRCMWSSQCQSRKVKSKGHDNSFLGCSRYFAF